ncbi:MAG: hypothetical protein ACTHMV_09110 [Chitinophagaceae bacterium]
MKINQSLYFPIVAILLMFSFFTVACNNNASEKGTETAAAKQPVKGTPEEYLKENFQSPEEYILSKFKTHDVILLSEDHAIKHNLVMAHDIIPQLYKAGIYNFGMEFGAEEDQATLDSLVTAPAYSEDVARRIMFNYNVGWVFNEYMDIYRAAWELNHSLPAGSRPFRILNISYRYNWAVCEEKYFGIRTPDLISSVFNRGNTEFFRADLIKKQILDKNEKILVLCGFGHAFTKYNTPYYDYREEHFYRFDTNRMGNILYRYAPDKVFTILLHYPFESKTHGYAILYAPAGGQIDSLMKQLGNHPAGFDLEGTPLGELRDTSANSIGYKDFKLSDMANGYIFYKPFEQYEGCTIDPLFLTDKNWPEVVRNYPDKDIQKVPKNKEEYIANIGRYVDLKFRYRNLKPIGQ